MDAIDLKLASFYEEIEALSPSIEKSPERKARAIDPIPHTTPAEVRLAHAAIVSLDPQKRATPKRKFAIQAGLRVLTTLSSPKRKNYADKFREGIFSPEVATPGSAEASKKAHKFLRGEGRDWVREVITVTNTVAWEGFLGIDFEHLLTLRRDAGFHFCKATDPRFSRILNRRINPETGVWVGSFEGKLSSFFPHTISNEDALAQLLLKGDVVGSYTRKKQTKLLALASSAARSFYVLMYQEKKATIITAFPLFYAKDVEEIGEDIEVDGLFSVKKPAILEQLSRLSEKEKEDRIEITLDSGKHLVRLCGLDGIPFEKGIYLVVNSADLGGFTPSWEV